MKKCSCFGLPSYNIFGLDVIQLSFLYNLVNGKISDEELEEIEALWEALRNERKDDL